MVLLAAGAVEAAITIDTVPVGNTGNTGELSGASVPGGLGTDRICGAVDYVYNIGKYEVTAGQYTAFLNAVAAVDTYALYDTLMWSQDYSFMIRRTDTGSGYSYSVASDWANRPVNHVSWADAARFCNWLANSQPTGDQGLTTTEDGSYFLNGAMSNAALMAVTRKASATWVIPTEDEWYKAAYHKNDGDTGNYFIFPTGTDSVPSNDLINPDPGNNANFYDTYIVHTGPTIGSPYWRTEVGEFENSESPYGTFDQGGNVWECNETVIGSSRGSRGGAYGHTEDYMMAGYRYHIDPSLGFTNAGFRVVQVPEPATMGLLALGGLGMLIRRRGLRR
jgi:formylglycine-generating enzyme required for sulfatase activity